MHFAQLLGRQRRAEIPIAFANHRQRLGANCLGLSPVAGAAAALRDQTTRTLSAIRLQQPIYLSALEPQKLYRGRRRQAPLIQIPQPLEPRQLPIAHQSNRHPKHPPENPPGVSFQTGTGGHFNRAPTRQNTEALETVPAEARTDSHKRVECYSAADATAAERRPAKYLTPSASVCSSCMVPAGTLQESPGP